MDSESKLVYKKPPVFIVGCDRSGTTLLRLMLTQSSTLHIPNESRFARLIYNKEDYGDYTQSFERSFFVRDLQKNKATAKTYTFSIFGLTISKALEVLEEAAPTDSFGAIDALFTASACESGKQSWGDKTPRHINELPLLSEGYPKAKFIHVIRDGRDVAISIHKAGWIGNLTEIAEYWCEQVRAGKSYGAVLGNDRYYEIRYEDLVLRPEEELTRLCRWLKIDFSPEMLEYHHGAKNKIHYEHKSLFTLNQKPLDPSRIYAWRHTLTDAEVADIEIIQGELLEDLGYEISGKNVPSLLVLSRKMKTLVKAGLFIFKDVTHQGRKYKS